MIPILFPNSNIRFLRLGKGKLAETISCIVHEELNGEYEMTLRYPITGKHYAELMGGGTVGAIAPEYDGTNYTRGQVFFDIDRVSKPIDGIVEFKANHISRRLSKSVFRDSSLPADSYNLVLTHSVPTDYNGINITASASKPFTGTLSVPQPKSALSVLIGSENSLVSEFGGDFVFSCNKGITTGTNYLKLQIIYMAYRGEDRGAFVRFGVNMLDIEHEKDMTGAYNAVVPFWDDGNGNITYASGYLVQPTTPITPVIAVPLDLSSEFDTQPTSAQLVTAARDHLDSKTPWTGSETIKVDFVNGAEIDPHAPDIQLGDTVHVYWGDADIATDLRVVAYDYDVLAERYISLELGAPQTKYVAVTGESYAGASGGSGGGETYSVDSPTYTGGTYDSNAGFGVRKYGRVVTVGIVMTGVSTSSTFLQIATLSEGFRPLHTLWLDGLVGYTPAQIVVYTNGKVYVRTSSALSNQRLQFGGSWITS